MVIDSNDDVRPVEHADRTAARLHGSMIVVTTRLGRASAHFVVDGAVDDVRSRVERAARLVPRFRLRSTDGEQLVIATRPNWASWGGTMTVRLGVAGAASTLVDVDVTPVLPTTMTDWGQGARDVRLLHERLVEEPAQ